MRRVDTFADVADMMNEIPVAETDMLNALRTVDRMTWARVVCNVPSMLVVGSGQLMFGRARCTEPFSPGRSKQRKQKWTY